MRNIKYDTNVSEMMQMIRPLGLKLRMRLGCKVEVHKGLKAQCIRVKNWNLINKMIRL